MDLYRKSVLLSLAIGLIFSFSGFLFPNTFWSVHFLSFSPNFFQIGMLIFVLLAFIFLFRGLPLNVFKFDLKNQNIAYLSTAFFILILMFPMVVDYYGDAYKFNKFLEIIPSQIPPGTHEKFFTLELSAWSGEGTILALVTYTAYYLGISYKDAFWIFDAIMGAIFLYVWLKFVSKTISNTKWQKVLILLGVVAPFTLVFYRHIEIYAPVFVVHLLLMSLFVGYLITKKRILLWSGLAVLIFSLKFHLISLILFPALGMFIFDRLKGRYPNWKETFVYIIVPVLILGLGLYFFYFEDYKDGRSLQQTTFAYEHLFLPLLSPDAPLDSYNIFSFNHILDFLNLFFIWSPIGVFVLLTIVVGFRKQVKWNAPEVVFSGLCFFLMTLFMFAVNPLLSMPIDWDLFAIPAVFFIVFVTMLVRNVGHIEVRPSVQWSVLILVILTLPAFVVHQSEQALSLRLESVANRIYTTYYEWTAQTLDNAFLVGDYKKNRATRGEAFIKEIQPMAQKGIDYEFSALLIDQGRFTMRTLREYNKALGHFDLAQEYYHKSNNAKLLSLEAYFYLENYPSAYKQSEELVTLQIPSYQKALRMKIHCALEAEYYDKAYQASTEYLTNWPADDVVQEVNQKLSQNENIAELKFLFQNPARNSNKN